RTAQTVLRLKDGENQVLAGLINDEERRSAYKVPALGEIPLVGRLFGSQADDAKKSEIVLSITPRIVRNVVPPDAGTMEFESGTEADVNSRIGGTMGPAAAATAASGAAPSTRPSSPAGSPLPNAGSTPTSPSSGGSAPPAAGAAPGASGGALSTTAA